MMPEFPSVMHGLMRSVEAFLRNSSALPPCRLSLAKDILSSLCAIARRGTRRLEESPPTVQRAVWNVFTSHLMPILLAP